MLDGACRIDQMVDWAVENSSPGIALTDHGNMFGALEFYQKSKKSGVNPIIGCEVYVAPQDRRVRDKSQSSAFHLTLLAENSLGYHNLLKLVSLGYTEGFYYNPRIDMEILSAYSEGIIALTGCIAGFVPKLISSQKEQALTNFKQLKDVMGENNLFVEVQNHYLEDELKAYPLMAELAKEYGLPIVGTNDVHYPTYQDHQMHDVMLCIQMKKNISEEDRIRFDNEFYFKNEDEMQKVLEQFGEESISNTLMINERCNIELEMGQDLMPKFDVPQGYDENTYLEKICYDALKKLYGSDLSNNIQERINHELGVIQKTGYAGYFLIVWDFVSHARSKGHFLSARGSAGSSLVLYAIGVINFNPMDFGCVFERFLNTERISPPDIDIDFSGPARESVIEYLREKYGEESVAKVATFTTFNKKSAINDVGRALEISISDVKKIQKGEINNLNLNQLSGEIEGLKRHASSHPSAYVVSNGPLTDHIPVFKDSHNELISQYEGKDVEKLGIVKFDLLNVSSITEVQNCINLIKENHGVEIKLEEISLEDEKTYNLINRGLNTGLFQISASSGMKKIVNRVRPRNFSEFVAISALYRPGPLQSGMTDKYINRKNKEENITYIHPLTKNALEETYGVCIYQEQVMQIARDMAGFTLGEADVLRSAMGKVNKELLLSQREKFIEGSRVNGVTEEEAGRIFDIIEPFGSYAFNKSHTVAYSLLSYQMAYLKCHYPCEFIAALMSGSQNDPIKLFEYQQESKALGKYLGIEININPPDINKSSQSFSVKNNDITFGLECLKGVGLAVIEEIVSARNEKGEFESLYDFCKKVDRKKVKKKAIEVLVESGTFDSLEPNRKFCFENIQETINSTKDLFEDLERGQMSLWGEEVSKPTPINEKEKPKDWSDKEKLEREKSILGFYITGHPLEKHQDLIDRYTSCNISEINDSQKIKRVSFIATITSIRKVKTRKNKIMILISFEDIEGKIEGILFPGVKIKAKVEENEIVWVRGITEQDNNPRTNQTSNQIKIDEIISIDKLVKLKTTDVVVRVDQIDMEKLVELQSIALNSEGNKNLILSLPSKSGRVIAKSSRKYSISAQKEILEKIRDLFGQDSVILSNRSNIALK